MEQKKSFVDWYEYGFTGQVEQAAKMDRADGVEFLAREVATFIKCDPNYKRENRLDDLQFNEHFALYLVGRMDELRAANSWDELPPVEWDDPDKTDWDELPPADWEEPGQGKPTQEPPRWPASVVLKVRVDYLHNARNPQHAETAARMVVADRYPTIESGVKIKHVEVYNDGDEIFMADEMPSVPTTPPCYRVSRDKKTDKTTVWDDCAGVGLCFSEHDRKARYNYEIITRRGKGATNLDDLAEMQQAVKALEKYAAARWGYAFEETKPSKEQQ